MPYLAIYRWTQNSLRQIKRSKYANDASELLFMRYISGNLYLIYRCLN